MTEKVRTMIMAGLEDAIAFVNGDATRGRVAEAGTSVDVGALRARTGKTQKAFAAAYGLPYGTVRDWEQGARKPDAPARALLTLIAADPEGAERVLSGEVMA